MKKKSCSFIIPATMTRHRNSTTLENVEKDAIGKLYNIKTTQILYTLKNSAHEQTVSLLCCIIFWLKIVKKFRN